MRVHTPAILRPLASTQAAASPQSAIYPALDLVFILLISGQAGIHPPRHEINSQFMWDFPSVRQRFTRAGPWPEHDLAMSSGIKLGGCRRPSERSNRAACFFSRPYNVTAKWVGSVSINGQREIHARLGRLHQDECDPSTGADHPPPDRWRRSVQFPLIGEVKLARSGIAGLIRVRQGLLRASPVTGLAADQLDLWTGYKGYEGQRSITGLQRTRQ